MKPAVRKLSHRIYIPYFEHMLWRLRESSKRNLTPCSCHVTSMSRLKKSDVHQGQNLRAQKKKKWERFPLWGHKHTLFDPEGPNQTTSCCCLNKPHSVHMRHCCATFCVGLKWLEVKLTEAAVTCLMDGPCTCSPERASVKERYEKQYATRTDWNIYHILLYIDMHIFFHIHMYILKQQMRIKKMCFGKQVASPPLVSLRIRQGRKSVVSIFFYLSHLIQQPVAVRTWVIFVPLRKDLDLECRICLLLRLSVKRFQMNLHGYER